MRAPSNDKSGLKKGTWSAEEDSKLIAYVTRYGSWNWSQLPRFAGLARSGKSCRLRWLNYLRPNLKRGNFTKEEEEIIIKLHQKLGNKWSVIATHLAGRTDNEIKNHWNTTLKERFGKNAVDTNKKVKGTESNGSKQSEESIENNDLFPSPTTCKTSESVPLSPQLSSSEFSSTTWDNICRETDIVNANFHGFSDAAGNMMDSWVLSESPLSSYNNEDLVMDFAFLEALQPTTTQIAPLVNQFDEYFSYMMYDMDLWSQTNFKD